MRQTIKYEFWVGLFLLLGIAALVFLGLRVANVQGFGETKSYTVTATFDNIGGLKVRAPLKLGGVVIGRVSDITLDEKSYLPKVSIAINEEYKEKRFYIIDDIYATGNTMKSIKHTIEDLGGIVVGQGVIMNIVELNDDNNIFSLLDINEGETEC